MRTGYDVAACFVGTHHQRSEIARIYACRYGHLFGCPSLFGIDHKPFTSHHEALWVANSNKRGKREKFWIGRWRESVVEKDGGIKPVMRSEVLGPVSELSKETRQKCSGRGSGAMVVAGNAGRQTRLLRLLPRRCGSRRYFRRIRLQPGSNASWR
jgi:hypothetical protein